MTFLKANLGKSELERLKRFFKCSDNCLNFLAYKVNFVTTEIFDELNETLLGARNAEVLWILLAHLSKAEPTEKTGKLVKFRHLPGGEAYDKAFLCRAVQPISEVFGGEPERLVEAAKALGGFALNFGDVSVEIPALPRVPLTYILRGKGEFPASSNVLFDESASHYLPTEDLAILAEITTSRLRESLSSL